MKNRMDKMNQKSEAMIAEANEMVQEMTKDLD